MMNDPSTINIEQRVLAEFQATVDIAARVAVIESSYATEKYVIELQWEIVKWLVGVAIGGFTIGAGIVALLTRA